jgi:hypothetical protein
MKLRSEPRTGDLFETRLVTDATPELCEARGVGPPAEVEAGGPRRAITETPWEWGRSAARP